MNDAALIYRRDGHIGHIVIAHERRRNALSLSMWRAIPERMREAAQDPAVRLVVIQGAGPAAFCAGADISEFATLRSTVADVEAYEIAVTDALASILDHPKPTLAAIRGVCFGGGLEVALCCDLRLADETARFRMPGAQLGLGYAYDAVALLQERLGAAATADILFSGREIGAPEAHRMGIVQQLATVAAFDADFAAVAGRIAGNAPLTLLAVKRALLELRKPAPARDRATVDRLVAACFASQDYAEGQAAFREKREPLFRADAGPTRIEEHVQPSSAQR